MPKLAPPVTAPLRKPGVARAAASRVAVFPRPETQRRLVVVSNRIAKPQGKTPAGGLAVAVLSALNESGGIWFGWSGQTTGEAASAPAIDPVGNVTYATLDLKRQDFEEYYNGYANRVLWPLFHFRTALVEFRRRDLDGYRRVNQQFALHLFPLLKPADLVWIHDYHLIPLAEALRRRGAKQPLGFFLHTPFPPPEMLRIVPNHEELIRGLCNYDLVGFQTESDRHGFTDYLVREAGAEPLGHGVYRAFGRTVRAEVFPIGIDTEGVARIAAEAAGSRQTRRLLDSLRDRALIIGVDRLDYSKGLLARFEAFGKLIENFPETRGRVTFMQIAPPTRSEVPEYLEIRRSLETLAGHINGRFAEFDWTPLRYLNKSFAQRPLTGFFRASRIGLVTPLRDGMNLVAKEYVASQNPEDPGALVLSCFAGAARELGAAAVMVNPFDIEGMSEAMKRALDMPQGERRERWQQMMRVIERNTIGAWRESFLRRLAETKPT
jgi:trehalose 6-phosphate synthase